MFFLMHFLSSKFTVNYTSSVWLKQTTSFKVSFHPLSYLMLFSFLFQNLEYHCSQTLALCYFPELFLPLKDMVTMYALLQLYGTIPI